MALCYRSYSLHSKQQRLPGTPWRVVVLACLAHLFFSTSQALAQKSPERELFMELDTVEGAKSYEVKIEPIDGTPGSVIIEKITKPEIAKKLPLGTYHILTRALDNRGVPGQWTDVGNAEVKFKPPTLTEPKDNSRVTVDKSNSIDISFKWTTFHPKADYQFELRDQSGAIVETKKISGSSFQRKMNPGAYKWRIKSILSSGVKLQGPDPAEFHFIVAAKKLADPTIAKLQESPPKEITWEAVPNAESYKIQITKVGEKGRRLSTPAEISATEVKETRYEIAKLEPGTYRFAVTAAAPNFESSRARSVEFMVKAPPSENAKDKEKDRSKDKNPIHQRPNYHNLVTATGGPVLWQYNFSSTGSRDSFNLNAATVTTIAADLIHWFGKDKERGLGIEARGRQTNIYLFTDGDPANSSQDPVTVADRRFAALLRYRKSFGRLSLEGLFGLGTHHYTYLIQDGTIKTIRPNEGELREYYLGGILDYDFTSGHQATLDFTIHPTITSKSINVQKTKQYTVTAKFLQNLTNERIFLVYGLENYRSSVTLTSEYFDGEATTISSWYRLAIGAGIAF